MEKSLLILGFGGHARSVADLAIVCGYKHLLFVDENAKSGEELFGYPVIRELSRSLLDTGVWEGISAAGDNQRRSIQSSTLVALGLSLATLISPRATIGVGAHISPGCFIGHHAHIGPMASIGVGCIINTGAIVEHEVVVEGYAHVSVNATVAGRSSIGGMSFIGAGATVIDAIKVSRDVQIGAGACVVADITQSGLYVGVPAKLLARDRLDDSRA